MKQVFALLMLFNIWSQIAVSQDQHKLKLSGFGFWVQELPRDGAATLKLKHAWVIVDREFDSSFSVRGMFAFAGPPRIVHSLFGKWAKPFPGVDYVRGGRFEPPFGHVNYYRIDRNPTIRYSAIDYPLVARSNGVEVSGIIKSLGWKLAAFSGERLLGNIPAAYENQWDMYVRPTCVLNDVLSGGVSARFGPVRAWGADVQVGAGPIHLELEGVSSRDTTNYTALATCQAWPWLRPVLRYEYVLEQSLWTSGFSINLPHDAEVKVDAVYTDSKIQAVLGQLVVRW